MNDIEPRHEKAIQVGASNCPVPLRDYPEIVMGHGSGGKLSAELVEHLFVPAFHNEYLADLGDAAVLSPGSARLAFSTDSFVVRPLFFPGGNIGDLAVNGTINDLAMRGAHPKFLSVGFILEEGFSLELLSTIANTMGEAAKRAGVQVVTGDTKVVERGHGDGCYINTSGIGILSDGVSIGPQRAREGDVIILSGPIADHGMAILSVREGLEFEAPIVSDTAPLGGLVETIIEVCSEVHVLRDPTRGGVATSLNEIALASNVGIVIQDTSVPINTAVASACDLLGLDPLFVANEGKLVAIVPPGSAERVLAAMHRHEQGKEATIIGHVTSDHPTMVVARTALGATRVITMQMGEQLPRIC